MPVLNAETMRKIARPYISDKVKGARQREIIESVGAVLGEVLTEYDMNTELRAAHFLAQTCHESADFSSTEEHADGSAYEGRIKGLGNTQPGDGPRYKGRGLIQLTGRANYTEFGQELGLVEHPERAADPVTSLRLACEFWKKKKLNPLADRDDIAGITLLVNGGDNGLDDRKACLARAKAVLGASGAAAVAALPRRGDKNTVVRSLQTKLNAAGIAVGVDDDFGGDTEKAVKAFQTAKGLPLTGVVDQATWAALG